MENVITEVIKFSQQRDWDKFHSPENLAKSISIEAGELLECFQWDDNFDFEDVCSELADVMTYCILLADKLGVESRSIIMNKLEKSGRKYPISTSKGTSLKYTKLPPQE